MRAHVAALACGLVVLGGACGGSPAAPSALLTEQVVTDHYVFHYSPGDTVDTARQEAYHAWAVAQLGVTPPRVTYNKYRDRAQMGQITGHLNTNGYADPAAATVHIIFPSDNHEVVHVYAGPWGFPVALFVEGLAVAHQMNPAANDFTAKWSGTPIHELARRFRAQGTLVPIAQLAETAAFRARDDNVTYPEAGSFVRFLIDSDGIAAMRRLYGAMSNEAPLASVRGAFLGVYGYSLDEAEVRWQRFLDGG
jgi:hypothetical protein